MLQYIAPPPSKEQVYVGFGETFSTVLFMCGVCVCQRNLARGWPMESGAMEEEELGQRI